MTQTQKSFVQVASNSLTLDDISQLIERAKAGEANRKDEPSPASPASAVPEPHGGQYATAAESYNQTQTEPLTRANFVEEPVATPPIIEEPIAALPVIEETIANPPMIEEPVAALPNQSHVQSVTVPLVRLGVPETNKVSATKISTPTQHADSSPLSFESALNQLESRNRTDTTHQTTTEGEPKILPRRRSQSVQKIPFVSTSKRQSEAETVAAQPRNDIQEQPSDWLSDPTDDKSRDDSDSTPQRATSAETHQSETHQSETSSAIDDRNLSEFSLNILENFPLGPSCVLLIADVDGDTSSSEVANLLARELAAKHIGRILLIDSHFEKRALTQDLAPASELGIADVISMDRSLDQVLCDSDKPNLDFLPAGTPIMCRRRDQQPKTVAELTRKLKSDYQFTVISVGSAFDHAAKVWAKHSEATYVTVSMSQSNRTVAKTGVRELQRQGARLMGCVVTDAAA